MNFKLLYILCLIPFFSFTQGGWISKAKLSSRIFSFSCNIGNKGYVGGGENISGGGYFNDWWEYDPTSNVWTQKADFEIRANGRSRGTAFGIGSYGYIVGGRNTNFIVYDELLEYNPINNSWSNTGRPYPGRGRWGITSFVIGNKAYVGSGTADGSTQFGDFYEYSGAKWTKKSGIPVGRNGTSFSINGKGYSGAGNSQIDCGGSQNFYEYDPIIDKWSKKADIPEISMSCIGFSIGKYGYLGNGVKSTCSVSSNFYRYDPVKDVWITIESPGVGSGGYSFTIGNKGYAGGGSNFKEFDICASLTFDPNKNNIKCNNENNGSLNIVASGGTEPYKYSINNGVNYQTTNKYSNLPPNNYTIKVIDSNLCESKSQTVSITEPLTISFTISKTNIKCFGKNTGSILVNASGGTGGLQYSKDNGVTWQISNKFQNLFAGEYNVQIKDSNGCASNIQNVILTQPNNLSFTTQNQNPLCANETGKIIINAIGGTLPYLFSINNGSTFQTSNEFLNLKTSNNSVLIKDSNQCVSSKQTISIVSPSSIGLSFEQSNLSCYESNDGIIKINATGGISPYNFSVDGGKNFQSSNNFTKLSPGKYNIFVRDTNNCKIVSELYISGPEMMLKFTDTLYGISCYGSNNGSLRFSPSGGTLPYQFSIDNGKTFKSSNLFTQLPPNTYDLVIKDKNNCITYSKSVLLNEPKSILFNIFQNDAQCFNSNSGSVTITASGGNGNYKYSKDNGVNYQVSNVFSGLSKGNYNIKVKDLKNCTADYQTAIILEPFPVPKPIISVNGPINLCFGDSVILTSSLAKTYMWSNNEITKTIIVKQSSELTVTITDTSGCSSTSDIISINVTSFPTPPIISSKGNTLSSNSQNGNQWYFNNEKIIGAIFKEYIVTKPGNYTVEVSNNNCKILSDPYIFKTNEIIHLQNETNINIFPNPTDEFLNIKAENVEVNEIKILDYLGKLVYYSDKMVTQINLSELPKGLYLLIIFNNNQTFNEKIIIQ